MLAKYIAEKYNLNYRELANFLSSKNIKPPYDIPNDRVESCVKAFERYEAAKNAGSELEEVTNIQLQQIPVRPVQPNQESNIGLTSYEEYNDFDDPKPGLFSFSNIGKKIKTLAKVIFILGAIGSLISGIVICCLGDLMILVGLLTMVVGTFGSYISCFFMYGYGELIDKTMDNNERIESIEKQVDKIARQ